MERGCLEVFAEPAKEVASALSGRRIILLPWHRGARNNVLALEVLVQYGDLRANVFIPRSACVKTSGRNPITTKTPPSFKKRDK